LILPLLISTSLLATPVKDTVWWDTPGGKVMEHRDQTAADCSLLLYDDNGSVTFEWRDPGKIQVTAINWNWQFPDNARTPVAMAFGEVWLTNHDGTAVLSAVGHGSSVTFTTDRPVDELLRPANRIAVRTTYDEMSIRLRSEKIGVLLSRLRNCRDVIGR
jgi:hypothetical protein